MTIQHCVPTELLDLETLRALPPNVLATTVLEGRLGRSWYRFTEAGFERSRALLPGGLTPRWWLRTSGLERTFHIRAVPSAASKRGTVDMGLGERWTPLHIELCEMMTRHLQPHTTRGISVEAFDEGWYRTYAPDTGALRLCVHMALRTEDPARIGLDSRQLAGYPCVYTWQVPTTDGQVVWRNGYPVAEIVEDHTILVLPDVLNIPSSSTSDRLKFLEDVVRDCGLALRKSWPAFDPGARMARTGNSTISVRVRKRQILENRIVDVPAGATLEEILVHELGQPARHAAQELATVEGKPVRLSHVPRHGETIEFAWDRYR